MSVRQSPSARLILPEGKSEMIVFDESMPGFGVRVRAGGKRVWLVQFRIGNKQRRITLGSVDVLDPEEAKKRAKRRSPRFSWGAIRKQKSSRLVSVRRLPWQLLPRDTWTATQKPG
jgi:hypothetical protein